MKALDLSGQRFGRLTALRLSGVVREPNGATRRQWECRCDCGRVTIVRVGQLTGGKTQSCGCRSAEILANSARTHGMTGTTLYRAWAGIIARCTDPNWGGGWKNYGGRGITVCERWRHSFESFLADMGERPSPKHSIDRINNDGNYEPGNCRWATKLEQMRNMRRNRYITHEGRTMCLKDWARELGITTGTLSERLERYPVSEAMFPKRAARRW